MDNFHLAITEKKLKARGGRMYGDYIVPDEHILGRLIRAIEFGYLEEFLELVPLLEDLNEKDSSVLEWTCLMYAVHQESLDMVKALVKAGADVNIRGLEIDEFALNLAANGRGAASNGCEYYRNRKIYDYLFPLTSPELQQIAEETLNSRPNTIFN